MKVTTWVKRRQSDVQAVTQVNRLSLVTHPEADRVEIWKATVTTAKGDDRWRLRRGLRARHGEKRKRHGTWEIHRRLRLEAEYVNRMDQPEGAEATVEVGLAGSTRIVGKPRTGGSGGAG